MRARTAASVVLAAGLLLGSTGCSLISNVATQIQYDPANGVSAHVGAVKVLNMVAITDDGEIANLIMVIVNNGSDEAVVNFQYEGADGKVTMTATVPGNSTVSYGNTGEQQFLLEGIDRQPGSLLPVYVQYGKHTGEMALVPVLDTSYSEFTGLEPTPAPTPTPEVQPTQSSETPEATPTPEPTATNG